jgi:hypothetical protein
MLLLACCLVSYGQRLRLQLVSDASFNDASCIFRLLHGIQCVCPIERMCCAPPAAGTHSSVDISVLLLSRASLQLVRQAYRLLNDASYLQARQCNNVVHQYCASAGIASMLLAW